MRTPLYKLLIIILISSCWQFGSAQCDPPELLPTIQCGAAPEVCLQDACYSTQPENDTGNSGFCGPNTIINNPQYFQFTPTDTVVNINILVTGCNGAGNNGLQAAIIPLCDWGPDDVMTCDPGTNVGGTMELSSDQFIIGQPYWLLIDGSAGAICEYQIEFVEGVFEPGIDELLDAVDGMETACQGQDELIATAEPAITNAAGYAWSLPWGEVISSSNILNTPVPDDALPGIYTVCVFAFSGCDTVDMPWPCYQLEITEVLDIDKDPEIFCPEDLPFDWFGVTIDGPDTYTNTFDNDVGCPYDSIWPVMVFPEVPVGAIDTVHCGTDFEYESVTYSVDGMTELPYPGMGLNGCDSSAILDLILVDLEAELQVDCQNGEFSISPTILSSQPANATICYQWFENGVVMPGEDEVILVVLAGATYGLTITLKVNDRQCDFVIEPFVLNEADFLPNAPTFTHGDTTICPNVLVEFTVVDDQADIIEYVWTQPTGSFLSSDGGATADYDFSTANSGGEVCVSAVNQCGEGPQTCFMVNLIIVPSADFDASDEVCLDSIAVIQYIGEASEFAVYNWNFGGATIASGVGPGPFEVSWNTPGPKNISLSLAEVGCDTVFSEMQIDVAAVSTPVINCNSTINSISFNWDGIEGATDYFIVINNGPGAMQADTFVNINNLNPGDTITFSVTATGQFNCVSATTIIECYAQNCPAPTINLMGADSICLDQSSGTYDLTAIVNSLPADGIWSGPGIVDTAQGIFDPLGGSAGPGLHEIIFQYSDGNNCTFNAQMSITVFDSIDASFMLDSVICQGDIGNLVYTGSGSANASYIWNFDSGNPISGTSSGPYQLDWNTAGVKLISLMVEQNGCSSPLAMEAIEVKPQLQNPVINCSPNTSSVMFSWQDVVNSTGFSVNILTGQPGNISGNEALFDSLAPGDSVAIEIVTLSDGICPDLRDTVNCVARNCPMPIISLEDVNDICLMPTSANVSLVAQVTNGNGSGMWSGPGVIDVLAGIFDPNDATAGIGVHQITYTYEEDGCTFVQGIQINVNAVPIAMIVDNGLQLTCANGNELILDGSGSSPATGITYQWSTANGLIISGANSPMPLIGGAGQYQLLVTTLAGCVDSMSVSVTEDANAPTADAGPDDRLDCDINALELGGNSSESTNILYQWSTSDGSIVSDPTLRMIMIDGAGTYEIAVSDTSNGCVSLDQVLITIDTLTPIPQAIVDGVLDCDTEELVLQGSVDPVGPDYAIIWTTSDGNLLNGETTLTPRINRAGIYIMTATNLDNGCVESFELEVMADDAVISNVNFSKNDVRCFGENDGSIAILDIEGGTPDYDVSWSNGMSDMSISNLAPGPYSVTVTDMNGCAYTESFTIGQPQPLTFSLDADTEVLAGDSVNINVIGIPDEGAIESVSWFGGQTQGCVDVLRCGFLAVQTDTVFVMVRDTNGCEATVSVRIFVRVPRITFIPNVFSPNGDDVNDYFTVFGRSNLINVQHLRIFDRWGDLVFQRENFAPGVPELGWDGRMANDNLMPGVYVYSTILEYDDGEIEVVRGDITLIR